MFDTVCLFSSSHNVGYAAIRGIFLKVLRVESKNRTKPTSVESTKGLNNGSTDVMTFTTREETTDI